MSWYGFFFACALLHIILGMSWISIIAVTSIHGWSIECFRTAITCCCGCWYQNQLLLSFINQIYCALITSFPAFIIYPSIVVLYCNVYASNVNRISLKIYFYVSVVLMASYFPDLTNEYILLLLFHMDYLCILYAS